MGDGDMVLGGDGATNRWRHCVVLEGEHGTNDLIRLLANGRGWTIPASVVFQHIGCQHVIVHRLVSPSLALTSDSSCKCF